MNKKRAVIAILLIVTAIIGVAWILSNTILNSPAGTWVELRVWYGAQTDYNVTTEQFAIAGSRWMTRWDCRQIVEDSHFKIVVHDAFSGNVTKEIEPAQNQTLAGEYYTNVKGSFYLEIFIQGDLGNWWVRVMEFRQD